jgi:peptidyl-prolyl cis-trans isomerase A (cyclophilin A)
MQGHRRSSRRAKPERTWFLEEADVVAEELIATIRTDLGEIEVQLFPDQTPKTVRNFVELAEGSRPWTDPRTGKQTNDRLYDGTVFHRVIKGFMIQGGDPLGTGTGGPGYTFADEPHPELRFDRPYLVAMANAGPNTNGCQFFVTVAPTTWLNFKHSIFGEVKETKSRAVVDRIANVPTGAMDRPTDDVVIHTIEVERREV